ncbi:DNA polymerase III, delta subunit [Reichenbachiella agariperforans]|uniref:DNA polymerase III subunit delta n=1 Tax=Reichenbachiella agariperforans TaxID=156994 RepID=A0A1M6KTK5_REIAG|nr:DNA polymerase III subunit delta [Reichenbachiella agariperforans]SHJ62297.1 DNA polymerase III, delta subunit [Reichenbachiella agariperforans]
MAQFPEILKNLKAGQYAPVYLLQGEESFFIDQIVDYIEANAMDESMRGFNQIVVYGKDSDIPNIINHAKGYPMMAERKVIIVKEAQELAGLDKEMGEKFFTNYLENPQPSTILVLAYKYKSLDKRKKITKAFVKHAVVMDSSKMYDNQLPAWIEGYVKDKGKKIDQKALFLITENIGNNLTRISNEIDKMLINIPNEALITADHVYKNIGISKEYNVFELQKALSYRNVMKANEIIHYFKSDPKSNPLIPIIANVFAFFNKLLLIHHSQNKSDKHLASLLGVHPFFVKEYIMAAKNYPLSKVIDNIKYVKIADMKSKGIDYPSQSEGEIMKELVFSLLH